MKDALTNRITSGGIHVVRLHYSADPDKDPETPDGLQWVNSYLEGYPGGFENVDWQREMEIRYAAGGGESVFKRFAEWRVSSNIFIEPGPDVSEAKLYGSYDYGWTNPSCYLVHAVYPGGLKRTIWEVYGSQIPVSAMAKIIQGEDVVLSDGRHFEGNPYAGLEVIKVADPSIDKRDQVTHNGENKSIARIFRDEGVGFHMGERGDDSTVANWLVGNLWAKPQEPLYQICTNCRNLIWELGHLKHPKVDLKRNRKETITDKDNHAWDALKYFLKRFPITNVPKKARDKVATFEWWAELTTNQARGKPLPTYKRDMVR